MSSGSQKQFRQIKEFMHSTCNTNCKHLRCARAGKAVSQKPSMHSRKEDKQQVFSFLCKICIQSNRKRIRQNSECAERVIFFKGGREGLNGMFIQKNCVFM